MAGISIPRYAIESPVLQQIVILKPEDLRSDSFVIGIPAGAAVIVLDSCGPHGIDRQWKEDDWDICIGNPVPNEPFSQPFQHKVRRITRTCVLVNAISYERKRTFGPSRWVVAGYLGEEGDLIAPFLTALDFLAPRMPVAVPLIIRKSFKIIIDIGAF